MKVRIMLLVVALMLLLAACSPAKVTNIVKEGCCLTWSTDQEARCRVVYCQGTMCNSTEWDSEYSTDHCFEIPSGTKSITILTLDRWNHRTDTEVIK